ncbi:MAG: type II toxin-antitoxin system PemK/MazF family toxin [Patescibacteria group bacterium]
MEKDFDNWNTQKKLVEINNREVFGYPREVWWCSFGVNVGAEVDGKNENFERPVIIMRVYNKETMLVLPTTGREKRDNYHISVEVNSVNARTGEHFKKTVYVKLTQARVISNKRLLRKVDVIGEKEFEIIKSAFRKFT